MTSWLLAAVPDWTQFIVVGIALLIYGISALAKMLGTPPQANELATRESYGAPAVVRDEEPARGRRASAAERERFVEEQRRRRKPTATPASTVAKRHLHSGLEERHVETHVAASTVPKSPPPPRARRRTRRDPVLAAMLSRKQIGKAFVLGQVLQPPLALQPRREQP